MKNKAKYKGKVYIYVNCNLGFAAGKNTQQ